MATLILRPCPDSIDCPGSDSPVINFSSEAPDPPDFIGDGFFGGFPPIDPLPGSGPWTATACGETFISFISQLDADLMALAASYRCLQKKKYPPPFPGGPDPSQACCNLEQCCTLATPNGDVTFCVPAGLFCAPTCAEANSEAEAVACDFVKRLHGGLSALPGIVCAGTAFAAPITATNMAGSTPTLLWSIVSGSLPPGLIFPSGFSGPTVVITGTPTTGGTYGFSVRATNDLGNSVQRSYTICVAQIAPDTLPDGTIGTAYSQTLTLSSCAGAGLFWSVAVGTLPDGLSLDPNTGKITGTPTGSGGSFHFTITASGVGFLCSKEYTITTNSNIQVDAYWTLDEAAPGPNPVDRIDSVHGIALHDNSFGGNPGVPALFSLGLPRTWNASNGDFSTSNEALLAYNGTSGFSFFGWFKINVQSAAGNPGVFVDINFPNSGNALSLELANVFGGQPNVHVTWNANGSSTTGDLFESVSVGAWHFYHVFYDSALQKVGFSVDNGADQLSAGGDVFTAGATGLFDISGSSATGLDLILDETGLKVSAKLTPAEVTFLYNSGAGRTWPL